MEDTTALLQLAEGSGRVEFKRSCLWPLEKDEAHVQAVLMRLANANQDGGGVVELGREDDGRRVGLVDRTLQPVTEARLAAAEQRLVQVAARLDPPMHLRWYIHETAGVRTIVILVPGRRQGGWYQDPRGITITGSASHPVVAAQALLQRWAREGQDGEDRQQTTTAREALLASVITQQRESGPPPSDDLAYLYVVGQPTRHVVDLLEHAFAGQDKQSVLDDLVRTSLAVFRRHYYPDLSAGAPWQRHHDGWKLTSYSYAPRAEARDLVELFVDADGRGVLFCGRAAQRRRPGELSFTQAGDFVLLPDLIAGLTVRAFCLFGGLYRAAGYHGPVDVGLAVTGLRGLVGGHAAEVLTLLAPIPYAKDYQRTSEVQANDLTTDPRHVASTLVMPLVRQIMHRAYDPFV